MDYEERSHLQVYFSNRVEVLVETLGQQISSAIQQSPFTRHIVVAPAAAMHAWIREQIALNAPHRVAMGLSVTFLLPALELLRQQLMPSPGRVPSAVELSLTIELLLERICRSARYGTLSAAEQQLWREPIRALVRGDDDAPGQQQRQITALAYELATLFLLYGEYAPHLTDEWICTTPTPSLASWQQALWRLVFPENSTTAWRPHSDLLRPKPLTTSAPPFHLHLFAVSHLSELSHTFLSHISQKIPITYYNLSPCQLFWSDIVSDREGVGLQRHWQRRGAAAAQLNDLELYLRERNPILANFGRIGREFMRQLDQEELITHEDYRLSSSVCAIEAWSSLLPIASCELPPEGGMLPTALEALQADMALLRPAALPPLSLAADDNSIQVHCCCSPMREVQIAYDIIHKLINTHEGSDTPLRPCDIIIAAADINRYAPYLDAVFGGADSSFSYQLWGGDAAASSPFIRTFFLLLDLAVSRWDAPTVLELFEQEPFRRRHALEGDTINQMRAWLEQTRTSWGFDAGQRMQLLHDAGCENAMEFDDLATGTWTNAMARLATSLAMSDASSSSSLSSIHLEGVDTAIAVSLGRCSALVCRLRSRLAPIERGEKASAAAWARYLAELMEEHLAVDKNNSQDKEGHSLLSHLFEELGRSGGREEDALFPFSSLQGHLHSAIERCSINTNTRALNSIRCGTIEMMSCLPARAIICLGMDDAAFPRIRPRSSLNMLYDPQCKAAFSPSSQDRDRYLFLEALLSARSYFIATYGGFGSDGKALPPSLLICELLHYLDGGYRICGNLPSQSCCYTHPFVPFDRRSFAGTVPWPSASTRWYGVAAAAAFATEREKRPGAHSFLNKFSPPSEDIKILSNNSSDTPPPLEIDLRDLITLVRNPLQLYFNKGLGIYIESKWKESISGEDFFTVNPIENAMLVRKAVKDGVAPVMANALKAGKLPVGAFRTVAAESIYCESAALTNNLAYAGVDPSKLFNVTLCPSCLMPEALPTAPGSFPCLRVAPLQLVDASGRSIRLTGNLTDLASQGLVTYIKDDKRQISRALPEFLVACCLAQDGVIPVAPRLIFAKNGKCKEAFFVDPYPLLALLIDYYRQALIAPSPLLPEWVYELVEGDSDGMAFAAQRNKQLSSPFSRLYNDYLLWGLGDSPALPDAAQWAIQWQGIARNVFGTLFQAWY